MSSEGQALRASRPSAGRVAFVGGGPGDPSLLTLAAAEVLGHADLILLASPDLQALLAAPTVTVRPDAVVEVVPLGGCRAERVAEAMAAGLLVARLVHEDPLMDSDAAAEASACSQAGWHIEVIPGITSLTAVPEFAGVALRPTGGVQLMTVAGRQEMPPFAPSGMLVIRSVAELIDDVVESALASGRRPDEPVVLTLRGATTQQTSRTTTLGKLRTLVRKQVADPETELHLVIGGQTQGGERDGLDWYESKPLFGWRVLIPRTKDHVGALVSRLRTYGAESVEVPTMAVEPPRSPQQVDKAVHGLVEGRYLWIVFTSANAVRAIREKFEEQGLDARAFSGLKLAAVGTSTIDALHNWGLTPDLVPHGGHSVASLAAEFPAYDDLIDPINRVFVPRADIATETLATGLAELGWEVEDITAYRTVRAAPPPAQTREAIKTGQFDAVVFTSSSTVRNLVGIAGKPHALTVVAAVGTATAKTCEEHGLRVDAIADAPNQLELADALARFADQRQAALLSRGEPVVRPSQRRRARRTPR